MIINPIINDRLVNYKYRSVSVFQFFNFPSFYRTFYTTFYHFFIQIILSYRELTLWMCKLHFDVYNAFMYERVSLSIILMDKFWSSACIMREKSSWYPIWDTVPLLGHLKRAWKLFLSETGKSHEDYFYFFRLQAHISIIITLYVNLIRVSLKFKTFSFSQKSGITY